MGNQQLILVILSFLVAAIAIVLGVRYFSTWVVDSERSQIINEAHAVADLADAYYLKPPQLGGGGGSYLNFNPPTIKKPSNSGSTLISVAANRVSINVVGTELGRDSQNPIEITLQIRPGERILRVRN
ncbi:MAG: hypothetical protein KF721_06605 [Ignavibacteriaceae bacterium]|nr:hypothetical protein [Ignavibacteriaceae bacterium]HRI47998.1 hypothetical protein [Ignavibacteriaceae bacterium]